MPNPSVSPDQRCTKCGAFLFSRDLRYAKGYGHVHTTADGKTYGPVKPYERKTRVAS